MSIDVAVSRAVAAASLLESALHSQATWSIHIGVAGQFAERVIHERGVTFRACFTHAPEADLVVLCENGAVRSVRPFQHPGDGPFCIDWDLSLEETVSV